MYLVFNCNHLLSWSVVYLVCTCVVLKEILLKAKELDPPTSVSVIYAIISFSLNTVMSKSSEKTSNCDESRIK